MSLPIIVFDLDGTLVDTAPDLLDSLNHCLRSVDLPEAEPSELRGYVGFGGRIMIERAFAAQGKPLTGNQLESLFATFVEHYTAGMPGISRPYPGAEDALARFNEMGFVAAVCTNKMEHMAQRLLEGLGLASRFEAICGADTFNHRKPDPRHLLDTIARAGGDRDRAVMIGDSRTDIETAKAAGIPVIAVDFGYSDQPVSVFEPDHVISDFSELTLPLAEKLLLGAAVAS